MGNLAITSAIYAAQPQKTKTGSTQEKMPTSIMEAGKKAAESKSKDTEIVHDTVYIEDPNDTVYISEEEQERFERVKKESHEIVSSMYKAIDGLGTDNKLFEEALKKIDSDNILEVIDLWEETAGKEYNESFIESFLGDANNEQRQTYGNQLIKALHERITNDNASDDPNTYEDMMLTQFQKLNEAKFFPHKKKIAELFNSLAVGRGKSSYYEGQDLIKSLRSNN